jgi:hypothetical protein
MIRARRTIGKATFAIPFVVMSAGAFAQDEKMQAALNNVQSEMSECMSYYSLVKECVGTRDPTLAAQTQRTIEALTSRLLKLGPAIGMTQDAMLARLKMMQNDQRQLISNDCVNMSSLFVRKAARCKQVVESGDSILDEYLHK